MGVGFSVHIAYASYNSFHTPVHTNCLIAAFVNSFTSLFSGFVIFAYLGYMSNQMNKPLNQVVNASKFQYFFNIKGNEFNILLFS